jgi:allantoinase
LTPKTARIYFFRVPISSRDFRGYARGFPTIEWPDGNRLAVNFVVNYEEGSERNVLDGDRLHESISESVYEMPVGERELASESTYEYGSRAGIWRVLGLLERYGVRPTVFACGQALERNPEVAAFLREHSLDVVAHGYRWISPAAMSADEQRSEVRRAIESITASIDRRPTGWFSRPPTGVLTREILAEEGFLYDSSSFSDDVPYFASVAGRPFLVVPYTLDVNDIRFWRSGFVTADQFAEYCRDAFDTLRLESLEGQTKVLSIGLHARISGRPGRIAGLERFLQHLRASGDAWIADRTAVAEHWFSHLAPPDAWGHAPAAAQV